MDIAGPLISAQYLWHPILYWRALQE